MKFKLPEDITALDADKLAELLDAAMAEYKEIAAISDDEITDEQLEDLEALAAAVATIGNESDSREAAANERAERIAKAKAPIAEADKSTEDKAGKDEVDAEAEARAEQEAVEAAAVLEAEAIAAEAAEKEAITASARRTIAKRAAAVAPKVDIKHEEDKAPAAQFIAAADVRGFAAGAALTLDQASEALMNRFASMPKGYIGATKIQNDAFTIKKAVDPRFHLDGKNTADDLDKVFAAAKEQREGSALTAAGGWCAPSETIYNIPQVETVSGILSLPEVTFNRGGINFTRGINFEDIYADTGWQMTETQAEAGAEKHFTSVTCPEFEEVRLDAIGWGLTVPILTERGYPELIKRFLSGALTAHAHKRNVNVIGRVVAKLGTKINATEFGSAVSDTLTALEIQAIRLRYKYRLLENAKMEGFAPIWFKSVLRADIAYQGGVPSYAVTDAQIISWLSARNINLQWIYDWQSLGATGADFPASVQVALYPAGTFVVGTADIISISAVYDSVGLKVNEYLATFFEEGLALFSPMLNGVLVEIALNYHGRTGAQDITGATPTVV